MSTNFRQLAAKKGWDNHFIRLWAFIEALSQQKLREKWWLWIALGLSAGVGIAVLILQNLAPTSDSVPTNVSVLVAQLNLLRHQNSLSLGRTSWVTIYRKLSMAPQDLELCGRLGDEIDQAAW